MRSGPPSSSVPRLPEIICHRPPTVCASTSQVCETPGNDGRPRRQPVQFGRMRR